VTIPTIEVMDDGMRVGEYVPGNGIRYTAVAMPWVVEKHMGALGHVEDGWLVVYGNKATAHLFQATGYLADRYIAEKLKVDERDFPWAGDLIRALVDRDETIITITCAWCGRDMGTKPGHGTEGISHGICAACKEAEVGS